MSNQIDNTQDVIDSREIIDRIEDLEGRIEDLEYIEEPSSEEAQELAILLKVQEQAEDCADYQYGEALIRESYFTDYIKELIADCYELPKEFNSGAWPWRHMTLDYEAAADEAKDDYTRVDFDGVTYLIRS